MVVGGSLGASAPDDLPVAWAVDGRRGASAQRWRATVAVDLLLARFGATVRSKPPVLHRAAGASAPARRRFGAAALVSGCHRGGASAPSRWLVRRRRARASVRVSRCPRFRRVGASASSALCGGKAWSWTRRHFGGSAKGNEPGAVFLQRALRRGRSGGRGDGGRCLLLRLRSRATSNARTQQREAACFGTTQNAAGCEVHIGVSQRQEGTDAGNGERLREGNKALKGRTPRADLARNKASRHEAEESAERLREPEGVSDVARQTTSKGSCHVRGDAEGEQTSWEAPFCWRCVGRHGGRSGRCELGGLCRRARAQERIPERFSGVVRGP